jgi:chemotaxis signal transduction protein
VLFAVPASEVEQARRRDDDRAAGVDLAAALGGRTRDGGGLMLIVRHQGNHLRLLADEVLKVAALPLAVIYPLPRLVAESQRGGYVSGVAICGDELALLLDPGALERETSAAAVAGQAPGGIEG